MRQIFEFACFNGHVTERLVESYIREIQCPQCAEQSLRLISTPRINLEGFTGAFPGAADKWIRTRAEKYRQAASEKDSD